VRCLIAGFTELGNDEVYYWTYSQRLQWNYFDHPPMVAVWIRVFTLNLLLEGLELFVRLGSIISAAICTWLLYRTTVIVHSSKAGWYAACLYTGSIYASVIAGVFIMPDSPQMLFWCFCLYLLAKIHEEPSSWRYWALFGLSLGLCTMSKVHAVFIPLGLVLYVVFRQRAWLTRPQIYVAAVIAAAVASPILLWNISNDFITYRFHSERVTVDTFQLNTSGFLREVFGQIGYNNPFNVFIVICGLVAWKKRRLVSNPVLSLYGAIALPMIAVLIGVALFRNTFPHWSGPAHVTLLPLGAVYLATLKPPATFPSLLRGSLVLALVVAVAGLSLIHFYPGTLGKKSAERLGAGDFTLDMHGWGRGGEDFFRIYEREVESGRVAAGTPVVSHKWFPAAHLDYYFCRPQGIQLLGLGTINDLHHYAWLNEWRRPKVNLANAFCIVPSNEHDDARARYAPFYATIDSIGRIDQLRSGNRCRYFTVYRLGGWKGTKLVLNEEVSGK
jgi:hypothetical protein